MQQVKRHRRGKFGKIAWIAAATITLAASLSAFAACTPPEPPQTYLSALKTQGEQIVNAEGETVYLRGVNAGGLGVIEQWMTGFAGVGKPDDMESEVWWVGDHKTTTKVFIERFGGQKAQELWNIYQTNWWKDEDFQNCADMGMNVIRLPFTYMNVDFDAIVDYAFAGTDYDFTFLDDFVSRAANHGLYTILDLHGAYGSQNGQDHSGESMSAAQVDFYSNDAMQELTVKLWRAVADHFKDNPNVAAYDTLNEPAERKDEGGTQTTTTRHFKVFDKIYKAIREVDQNHVVIFESCWDGSNLPQPSEYGWQNCMYSFHHYTSLTGDNNVQAHKTSFDNKLKEIASRKFGVPLFMGEFTCYDNEEQWTYSLELMNSQNWHWTSWTYKTGSGYATTWGIFNVNSAREKVNAYTDSYEEIVRKFQNVVTNTAKDKSHLSSGKTLYDVIKNNLTKTSATPVPEA